MRDPARKAVFERLVKPIGAPTFRTVVTAAYGDSGFTAPSASQAAGLITVADSFADEAALIAAWTAAADALTGKEG